ncbi:MAG: hypothetical protein K2X27_21615 [Candidatus Obscuribacterales bacterium]|nr:hypothetical protein [Candidatus Obscuribacterales bacterium]
MEEIENAALNEGLNPNQAQVRALIEYFVKNGLRLEHSDASYWRLPVADQELRVSIRTFPRLATEQQMRSALLRINLAYILNADAKMAMSYPVSKPENARMHETAERLKNLFLAYRLPLIYKPIVYSAYDKSTGIASLYANEILLKDSEKTNLGFSLVGLWKYDEAQNTWRKIPSKNSSVQIRPAQKRQIYSRATDQRLLDLTDEIGLFWVRWTEDEKANSSFVYSGPILCNDVALGPAPEGLVAVCVPAVASAKAMFVPDPNLICK